MYARPVCVKLDHNIRHNYNDVLGVASYILLILFHSAVLYLRTVMKETSCLIS